MVRVRQTFARPRVADIPRAVADALGAGRIPVKRGDTVAVGAGSRGIAAIDVIVRATVDWLRALGARPFTPPDGARVIRIKNTLKLGEVEVSEAFLPEVAQRPDLTQLGDPAPLAFDPAGGLRRG